ncbi:MAG TPA: hypothetical protein VFM58_06460, partial [Solirubrobacteraceae bacterium]|nr:hypothetical protein [Solirubrobacteraceae bacterium]
AAGAATGATAAAAGVTAIAASGARAPIAIPIGVERQRPERHSRRNTDYFPDESGKNVPFRPPVS